MDEILLEAKDVKKHFPVTKGLLIMKAVGWIKAVDGISFSINKEETFGLVGVKEIDSLRSEILVTDAIREGQVDRRTALSGSGGAPRRSPRSPGPAERLDGEQLPG